MQTLCYFAIIGCLLTACQTGDNPGIAFKTDTVQLEYADWYVLRSPENQPVKHVWGDIDNTLLITTGPAIYRSTNRGNTWQLVHKQSIGVFGIISYQGKLYASTTRTVNSRFPGSQFITQFALQSNDDGKTWQPTTNSDIARLTGDDVLNGSVQGARINPVLTTTGEQYAIRLRPLNQPNSIYGSQETPGVVTATGRIIDLPLPHQLQSLNLNAKNRLYIAGSDAVCGTASTFDYCNGGKGVVYVSKRPLP